MRVELRGDESCQPVTVTVVSDPERLLLPIPDSTFQPPSTLDIGGRTRSGVYVLGERATGRAAQATVRPDCGEAQPATSSVEITLNYRPGFFLPPVVVEVGGGQLRVR